MLIFSVDMMAVENIAEDAKYTGVRLKISCLLGNAANVLSIDIGFGDAVIPKAVKMQFPCILNSEPIAIYNCYIPPRCYHVSSFVIWI